MRILHLLHPAAPGGGSGTLRLAAEPMARLTSMQHDAVVLGPRADVAGAERAGVPVTGAVCPPAGEPALVARALRRWIRRREAAHGRYDLIHAWSLSAAVAAVRAAPGRPRLATFSVGPVTDTRTQLHRFLLARHDLPVLATSSAVAQEYRSLGVLGSSVTVLPPAVHPAGVDMPDRAALRQRWKVDDATLAIGLLGEPVAWSDARAAVYILLRAALAGRSVRLIIDPDARHAMESVRWAQALGRPDMVVIDDTVREPWRVVRGLDAGLVIGSGLNARDLSEAGAPFAIVTGGGRRLRPMPGVMPILWAMAAGVPVIAEASDAVRGVIEDGVTGLLVPRGDDNAASDRLLRIADDPTIGHRIGANAREATAGERHVAGYCVRLKAAYDAVHEGRAPHEAVTASERYDRTRRAWITVMAPATQEARV